MGDTLSKPVTDKHTSTGMQGWRKNMEDAHVAQLNLEGDRQQALLGVFDGHNGYLVAKYCGAHISDTLVSTPAFHAKDYPTAFTEAFRQLDASIFESPELKHEGGCTAVTALVAQRRIICANIGDSRAVLCRGGMAVPLSSDHKPTIPSEVARIEAAGYSVQNNRVSGTLALSRAVGDFEFKDQAHLPWDQQAITACPDVTVTDIQDNDEFIVLACDGVWDVISNQDCCDFIRQALRDHQGDVGLVCEQLLDRCIAPTAPGLGCDNMTVVIATLKPSFFMNHSHSTAGSSVTTRTAPQ
eukprot:CAMPEP_0176405332 /NCGR_PEP_ID=MMETSP0127-20121128/277_1 /TAXON_ID=938130 /ORGANISM="Platyophrya macrostoma, Strain WH" /LENGTH=297 /DNA_ID=CAMNT_0017784375 /DNA_START=57 /DNA_END=950 /DNA_ORIENTATION=-